MVTTITNDFDLIETKKVQLISIITQVYNFDVLVEIENLLINTKVDWWTTISKAEKKAIDEGLDDIKNGRVLSHQQVMQEFNSRYKEL